MGHGNSPKNPCNTHLIGAPFQNGEHAYNESFSIDPEGHIEGQYAKKHLVPFGEIVPWSGLLGKFISVLNDLGGFTAGDKLRCVLPAAGIRVGVNICYEAIFPNFLVRESVAQGAQVIVNMTNDGWYMRTSRTRAALGAERLSCGRKRPLGTARR